MAGEPVAYIIGEREFWSLPLKALHLRWFQGQILNVWLVALDKLMSRQTILDLGTGTGAIALALASEMPKRQLMGVDLKQEAKELAEYNASQLNIKNVTFDQGSWFEPIVSGTKFALIVSNPPYIDEQDPHLSQGDVRFEPKSALVADENGLADIRHISDLARQYLEEGGWLAFEHGYDQGDAVREIMTNLASK